MLSRELGDKARAGRGVPGGKGSRRERTPERALLRLAGRYGLGAGQMEQVASLLAGPLDWPWILARGREDRLLDLLFRRVVEADSSPPVELQAAYRELCAQGLAQSAALRAIFTAAAEEGLRGLALKGAAFAETLYRDPGLRPRDDADLWVRREERGCWEGVLTRQGYAPADRYPSLWLGPDLMVDLHLSIADYERVKARRLAVRFEEEEIWGRARPLGGLGPAAFAPEPEDHFLIVVWHLAKHSFAGPIWYADLEGLLAEGEGEWSWERLLGRARRWNLLSPLRLALGLLREEGRAVLPRGVLEEVSAPPPSALERACLRAGREGGRAVPLANLYLASLVPGLPGRARFLWESAFPGHGVMRELYPRYAPAWRWWFLGRRAVELLALSARSGFDLWRGGR